MSGGTATRSVRRTRHGTGWRRGDACVRDLDEALHGAWRVQAHGRARTIIDHEVREAARATDDQRGSRAARCVLQVGSGLHHAHGVHTDLH
eukprot:IDg12577t1